VKIWYQSSGALESDPLWDRYLETLRKDIQEVIRSDTTVDFFGVEISIPEKDRFRSLEYLNTIQIIRNALRSEEEGYDAFVVGCTFDPGSREIKEILNILGVFIGETSMHVTSMVGQNFSMIVHDHQAMQRIKTNIQTYGLQAKTGPMGFLRLTAEEIAHSMDSPEPILMDFRKTAEDVIRQGGEVLLPGCAILNQLLIEAGLRKIDGVPILDTAGVAIKSAEMMVDLVQANH
jgi:allantoin racemase